jgi:hypothetical protein
MGARAIGIFIVSKTAFRNAAQTAFAHLAIGIDRLSHAPLTEFVAARSKILGPLAPE